MDILRLICRSVLASILVATTSLTHAQITVSGDHAGTIYRLNDIATYQEGCFDPCLCPVWMEYAVRGTFVFGPSMPGNVVDFREITGIYWRVYSGDVVVHTITGTGMYRVTNFDPDQQHALDLDLSIDGEPPQHFFSDFTPVAANGGTIDLPVSMNGVYCYDIVIRVSASPVPTHEVTPYKLLRGSSYQIACFDPCDCVSQQPRAMSGRFSLVPLIDYGTYAEYAIVNARFGVHSPLAVQPMQTLLNGAGSYTLIQGFAGPAHAMDLGLVLNGDLPLHFDQELENTSTLFPHINIAVDTNDLVCTDTVLRIRARPLPHTGPALLQK